MLPTLKEQTRWYARVQYALLASSAVAGGAFYGLAWRPAQARLAALNEAIARNGSELDHNRGEAGVLPVVRRQVERLDARLAGGKTLPRRQDLDLFMADVTRLRQEADLSGFTYRFGETARGPLFNEQPIDLSFEGDYSRVYEFVRGVGRMQRLTRVRRLELKPAAATADAAAGRVTAKMTVTLYFKDA